MSAAKESKEEPTFSPPLTTPSALESAWQCHKQNFDTDPVLTYILHTLPPHRRLQYIQQKFWYRILKSALLQGAIFDAAYLPSSTTSPATGGKIPAASAVWYPPGAANLNIVPFWKAGLWKMALELGWGGSKRVIWNTQLRSDKAKADGLRWPGGTRKGDKVKRFHYMFLISTVEEARGRGLSGMLIRRFMERVKGDGLPIWAEATTDKARRVYLRCGFRDVECYRIGKGVVGEDGLRKEGGEGVPVWAIVWFPPGTEGWDEVKQEEERS